MTKAYRNIFFDLDDTLWDFTANSRSVYHKLYDELGYDRYFASFDRYIAIHEERNTQLWDEYGKGTISKDELNVRRFTYPFEHEGIDGCRDLALRFMRSSLAMMPTMGGTVPGAHEVLGNLAGRYHLYILSNGFRELQSAKMRSARLDGYFDKVILSEDIMVHKPATALFHFALSATQSSAADSLMVGDNIDTDIRGAMDAGIDQVWFNRTGRDPGHLRPTHTITKLEDLLSILP